MSGIEDQFKAQFSVAFVHAISSVSNLVMNVHSVDIDSVDLTISSTGHNGYSKLPRIDVQLKATSNPVFQKDGMHFPLSIKNYNDLRVAAPMVPRILVVLAVPKNQCDWLNCEQDKMVLFKHAYWVSIRGAEQVENLTTKTVLLPGEQQFTPDVLQSIMGRLQMGEDLTRSQ